MSETYTETFCGSRRNTLEIIEYIQTDNQFAVKLKFMGAEVYAKAISSVRAAQFTYC